MSNPMGVVTSNPSNIKLTPTMKSGNMVGVNNVQPLQNITNPKSVGQPSANGYTVGSTNPNFKPFTDYKPVEPVSNPPQAIQTQASPVGTIGSTIGKGLGIVGAGYAAYKAAEDLGDALGFFANYGQYVKNALETDRLKNLINEREKLANQRRAIDGSRIDNSVPAILPPFKGGQSTGVYYVASLRATVRDNRDGQTITIRYPSQYVGGFLGSLSGSGSEQSSPSNVNVFLNTGQGRFNFATYNPEYYDSLNVQIIEVFRADGLPDTGGDPPATPADNPRNNYPPAYPPASEWPYGDVPVKIGGNAAKILDEQEKAAKANKPPKIEQKSNQSPDNLGKKTNNPPVAKSPTGFSAIPSVSNPQTKQSQPTSQNSGFRSIPANQSPATQIYANGMTNQDYNRASLQPFPVVQQQDAPLYQSGSQVRPNQPPVAEPKIQNTTPTTPAPDPLGILSGLAGIAGAIAALKIGSDFLVNKSLEIKNQTSPENLRDAAQKGSCDTLNSPSCTANLKNDIKTPILDKVNENAGALSALNNLLTGSILPAVNRIWDFLNRVWQNQAVDKVMQFITMITVIHNAAMVTRGIADTLGSAIDQGLQVFGLQLKDKEGNQIGVSTVIGQSVQNLIKSIIGADNYTALNETWIQANRIYQTGINLLSNVQSIIDSSTAVAELTSNRLGTWMNAARNAGLVRENAYGAQSENVTKFNAFQNKLEALEQGVSNTAAITGNVLSVQQSVNELKSNRQEFENALKNKPQGTGLPENDPEKQAAQQKKDQSIYTISDFSIVKPPETP